MSFFCCVYKTLQRRYFPLLYPPTSSLHVRMFRLYFLQHLVEDRQNSAMAHIFISYSKQDIDFTRYLKTLLEAEGYAVWVDEARLTPSARWWKAIEQNIETCSAFIIVMSPNAYESDWVEREILLAEKEKRPIIPVLLAGEAWSRLANIQHVDMRGGLRAKLSEHFLNTLKSHVEPKAPELTFTIGFGDITTYQADVVGFKYAGGFHGVDKTVSEKLVEKGVEADSFSPKETGEYRSVESKGAVQAEKVLYVATPKMRNLGYKQLRLFAQRMIESLNETAPTTKHLAMTAHGSGFSLDEQEAMLSVFAGLRDAMQGGKMPSALEKISIVEINTKRVNRLRTAIDRVMQKADYATPLSDSWGYKLKYDGTSSAIEPDDLQSAGAKHIKPHAFVVLAAKDQDEDLFEYGIQTPVHAHGLLCERYEDVAEDHYSEQVLNTIKENIDHAQVVVVELTKADPGVYLQLGYAWGKGIPTILLLKEGEEFYFEIPTDVIRYQKIKDVETAISEVLDKLKADGKL